MTFTYSSTSLGTNLAKVRLALGDTDSNDPLLTDEEINAYLTLSGDIVRDACVRACQAIVAKFAREVNTSAAGINSSKQSKFQQYKELLALLKADAPLAVAPFGGGTSRDRQDSTDLDTDFRPHSFGVGMHDFNGADDNDPEG